MSSPPRQTHTLEVYGDFACFTRPEMKVERFSYPCPTPAAARAIFEAIFYKPEFRWQVSRIELLSFPNYVALRRNEVKDKAPERSINSWIAGQSEPEPLFADLTGEEGKGRRTQRQTMALKSPRYRISAYIQPRPGQLAQTYDAQFIRRASQGKTFYQPSFGCREFVCFFKLIDDLDQARRDQPAISYTQELGYILYDVWDLDAVGATRQQQEHTNKKLRQDNTPSVSLFKAKIDQGVLVIPEFSSADVLKGRRAV
jgi:CRISPR-associated protein Cas5d